MKEINNLLNGIKKDLQSHIDSNVFWWCETTDTSLGLIDINADEFVKRVDDWDFTGVDNAVWYATQIQTLEKVISILER
tara:strand:+ start:184 stop:420 length:237 start_codon:yes stop_codon:yes gene_type:complete